MHRLQLETLLAHHGLEITGRNQGKAHRLHTFIDSPSGCIEAYEPLSGGGKSIAGID